MMELTARALPGSASNPRKARAATDVTAARRRERAKLDKAEPPCRSPSMANDLLYVGSWAVSTPEIPGFAPSPHDELALFDALVIGTPGIRVEDRREDWS